ncbi:MAG TPA: T9SS type A sorting domain-containing protein [Lentimicrobium sp.]|nr:T9SS type A sorting domain-containing protein [Lentimicrobium sp.]
MPISILYKILFCLTLLLTCGLTGNSQVMNDYGFEAWLTPRVTVGDSVLSNAWAGGFNNVQFGEIDLNRDGFNDLIAIDRHGNKLMPFIFNETALGQNTRAYIFDPSYRKFFPEMKHTMQLHDYNNDQLPDIFTYTTGGIMVYKNITHQEIKFEKAVNQFIRSLQGNVYTNLLVTNVDYPAVYDLDADGDLDILTFWGLGSFMELHQNMSMETYGIPDSLLYHKVDFCWGNFAENAESNEIILDTCIDRQSDSSEAINDRHTGSTLNVMDINDDGVVDLMLCDVDFMNIQALINGGTAMNAQMIQLLDSFPSQHPVNLTSFPSMQQIDAYNDMIKDLIISPFDPSLTKSSGKNSVWQYMVDENGSMTKVTEAFLQETMIDQGLGSYPILRDVNNDNLIDLVVGNYGKLDSAYYDLNGQLKCSYVSSVALYLNNGTSTQPSFRLVTEDLGLLSQIKTVGIMADIADINDDNRPDMVAGTGDGKLLVLFNNGYVNDVPVYNEPIQVNTSNAGIFLTPAIEDINGDHLKDLLCGNRTGKLSYYINSGSLSSPAFQLITHNYGMVNVTDSTQSYTGYSVPHLFRNKNDQLQMVVGSESGVLYYFPSLSFNAEEKIKAKNDVFDHIREGIRISASISDINNDSYPDMVTGNYAGGVNLFIGTEPDPAGLIERKRIQELNLYPNPASHESVINLPSKGLWEIKVYDIMGSLVTSIEVMGDKEVLDLNKMRSGLYVIVASHGNIIVTGKMAIIQ